MEVEMHRKVLLYQDWHRMASNIDAELVNARIKFPTNDFIFAALVKKVGGVAMTLVDQAREESNPGEKIKQHFISDADIYKKLVQVAAMAVRLAQEGDPEFIYGPPEQELEDEELTPPSKLS